MRTNIVLIDFESVQPECLPVLGHDHFKVMVFVGANQTKLSFETASALQQLGNRAEYIKISGSGPNALDFHIAYYIGVLASTDPTAYFHIVSLDKGFDPLISHLKSKKIFAGRVADIKEIPVVKAASKKSPAERVEIVLQKLRQPKATRPRSIKTLSSSIATMFQKQLSDEEVVAVIDGMTKAGEITIQGSKIKYAWEGDA